MKIAIVGYSGSGKSTLAKKIGEIYHCPVLYLDTVQFESNWKERDRETAKAMVKEFMKNDSWIIDGNYSEFYHKERIDVADKIIFMNFSRSVCLYRAYKRYFQNKNKTRESMADGCIEKIDFEFVKWILFDGRNKERKENYKHILNIYSYKAIELKNKKDVERLLEGLN